MESRKPKPLSFFSFLVVAVVLLLLLLAPQPASAVPTSRSMQLRNPPSLKFSSMQMQEMSRKHLQGRGRSAARMVVEVNDYPGSGANNRHDPPKAPGRG